MWYNGDKAGHPGLQNRLSAMLNLILPALYIAPILAVLFLERKKITEALLWVLVMCDFIANLTTPCRMFLPLVEAGGKVIRIQLPLLLRGVPAPGPQGKICRVRISALCTSDVRRKK